MPTLAFTVLPGGVAQLHDLLACLAKFDENISLEARDESFRISSLNTSKTAYVSFTLQATSFFTKYTFLPDPRRAANATDEPSWTCRLQNRALSSIFRRRVVEGKDKATAVERCEVELQAKADESQCRLIVRMCCKFGVVKTYRLTYESAEVLHASFDEGGSPNYWKVSSKTLRDVVEYFGPKTDHLDWCFENGKVTFTTYAEKVQHGREILRQPMHTSVVLERKDFDDFNVQEGLHIGIVVKDFRAVISHAETKKASVTARYSRGNRPMQIAYECDGVLAEYTLMTRGNPNAVPTASNAGTPARDLSVRPVQRPAIQESVPLGHNNSTGNSGPSMANTTQSARPSMAPPSQAPSFREIPQPQRPRVANPVDRNSPPAPSASINPHSMFIPADNDQQWDEPNHEDDEGIVTWGNEPSGYGSFADSERRIRDSEPTSFQSIATRPDPAVREIAPTQRLSQVKGLFD